jgi:hypothetical protein
MFERFTLTVLSLAVASAWLYIASALLGLTAVAAA